MDGRKYREIYNEGAEFLSRDSDGSPSGNADARLDARLLLEEVCGTTLQTLLTEPDRPVTAQEEMRYRSCLERRRGHEPTAMILGRQSFMGLDFKVTPDVLIPEQDSEILIEHALEMLQGYAKQSHVQEELREYTKQPHVQEELREFTKQPLMQGRLHVRENVLRILDLCTGSGCLIISLVHYLQTILPDVKIVATATDLSEAALLVAKENAARHGLEDVIRFRQGDMFEAVEKAEFDVIISNPPYIPTEVIKTLPAEVRCGEPHMALDGGADGLNFYRIIAERSVFYLKRGGILLTEIGYDQGQSVPELYAAAGLTQIRVLKDYGGNDRVVSAEREK